MLRPLLDVLHLRLLLPLPPGTPLDRGPHRADPALEGHVDEIRVADVRLGLLPRVRIPGVPLEDHPARDHALARRAEPLLQQPLLPPQPGVRLPGRVLLQRVLVGRAADGERVAAVERLEARQVDLRRPQHHCGAVVAARPDGLEGDALPGYGGPPRVHDHEEVSRLALPDDRFVGEIDIAHATDGQLDLELVLEVLQGGHDQQPGVDRRLQVAQDEGPEARPRLRAGGEGRQGVVLRDLPHGAHGVRLDGGRAHGRDAEQPELAGDAPGLHRADELPEVRARGVELLQLLAHGLGRED
mmetsp:Transcript_60498/g.163123  ORF Transcript_60498/g.163123 Transcript_60498/m.163123 type:complete len:299 (-) Transcript_60498:106-1002(-)